MRSTPVRSRFSQGPEMPVRRRPFSRAFLPALLIPLLGCTTEPTSTLPDGAQAFVPPAEYQAWWVSTEGCSAIQGNIGRIKWYVVPGVSTFPTAEGEKVGIRIKTGNDIRIVIAGNYVEHEMVVRHEMLHALLNKAGHPPEYFQDRCHLTWETWAASRPTTDAPPPPDGDELS
jgi:hypothetical protein